MKGFIQNITAIRKLWDILRTKFNFTHLCTNYTCQDPLENEFATVRRSCGCNDTPNVLQFGAAIKYNAVERTLDHLENTNCRPDETVSLIDSDDQEAISVDPLKLDQKNCLIDIHQNDLDFDKIDVPDKPEMNALVYVVGYVISKLPHEKCRRNFRSPSSGKHLDDECFTFTRLKKFLDSVNFNFPNEVALELGLTLLLAFKQKFYVFFQEHHCGVKSRLQQYVDHCDYQDTACLQCFNRFSDCLLNTFINSEVKKMQEKYKRKNRRNGKARRLNIELNSEGDCHDHEEKEIRGLVGVDEKRKFEVGRTAKPESVGPKRRKVMVFMTMTILI